MPSNLRLGLHLPREEPCRALGLMLIQLNQLSPYQKRGFIYNSPGIPSKTQQKRYLAVPRAPYRALAGGRCGDFTMLFSQSLVS